MLLACILYTEKMGQLLNFHDKSEVVTIFLDLYLTINSKMLKYFLVFHLCIINCDMIK